MLDKFATLYKKRCNNQFVVAQRNPLGVFRQAVFLHVASLSLVFLLRQDTSWCTMLVVAGKSAGSSSHFGRWSICVQLVVFVLKLAALKSWIDLWLGFWFFFLFSLSFLLLFLKKQPSHSAAYLTVAFYVIPTILLIYCFQTAELRIPSFLACNQNLAIVANL